MNYINPISFSDNLKDIYRVIDNEIYKSITNEVVPNVRWGQYMSINGKLYDEKLNHIRYPSHEGCHRYCRIRIFRDDGTVYHPVVHRIIMELFYPVENMNSLVVNHIDGNKTNNSILNLEWCTSKENTQHAIRTGLMKTSGEDHPMAKLTKEQVQEICKELSESSYRGQFIDIATKYNVTPTTIQRISYGKNWTDDSSEIDFTPRLGERGSLTREQAIEVCKKLEAGRYYGQINDLANEYGVSRTVIKHIIQGKHYPDIVADFNIQLNNLKLTKEQVHVICSILQKHRCLNDDVYNEIINTLSIDDTPQLRSSILRIFNRDPKSYINIFKDYKW